MNLTDYFNLTDSPSPSFNLSQILNETGLLSLGFNPYIGVFGDFFWGLFFGIIGVAIYSYKSNTYALIGYLTAVLALTRVVIPYGLLDLLVILLGLAVSGLIYFVFIKKKGDR